VEWALTLAHLARNTLAQTSLFALAEQKAVCVLFAEHPTSLAYATAVAYARGRMEADGLSHEGQVLPLAVYLAFVSIRAQVLSGQAEG